MAPGVQAETGRTFAITNAPWYYPKVAGGAWLLFAPLVFWTTSAAAYAVDTLVGTFVIVFAVMIPPAPGVAPEAHASGAGLPLGWSYSPSSYVPRPALAGCIRSSPVLAYARLRVNGSGDLRLVAALENADGAEGDDDRERADQPKRERTAGKPLGSSSKTVPDFAGSRGAQADGAEALVQLVCQ
jgi:hypothetical protein